MIPSRIIIFSTLLVISLSLPISSCSNLEQLPVAARKVVENQAGLYYTNPISCPDPFDFISKVTIQKAWLGKDIPNQANNLLWCVSLAISGQKHGLLTVHRAVWIVAPNENQSDWVAAALETISSDLPYQRCGQTIPGT